MRHLLTALFTLLIISLYVLAPQSASAQGTSAPLQGTYTVQPGDTLSRIAAIVGLSSWGPLYEANLDRIGNPNLIYVGQVLVVPGGTSVASPAPAPVQPSAPVAVAPAPAPAQPSTAPVAAGTGSMASIINAAAARYGQSSAAMLAVAQCESGLNPQAVNGASQASGLFQFLPSTWATTPFASQSIFNAQANANAAAWMWSVGRRGEWVC
jgi:LysM repeat protein